MSAVARAVNDEGGLELNGRMVSQLGIFAAAAVFEIAGCFAVWQWTRRGGGWLIGVAGLVSLMAFGLALARIDTEFAGRAYAAYGGVYIVASLAWLWAVEGQRPSVADMAGAALCIAGAVVILAFALRAK